MQVKFLGLKVPPLPEQPMPEGFSYTLGGPKPGELENLLVGAFEMKAKPWEPLPGFIGLPLIREAETGRLVAACSVLQPFFLHQFVVHPEYQKQGLGAALLTRTAQLFELPYVVVQTDDLTMESGHRFWKKQGFVEIGGKNAN